MNRLMATFVFWAVLPLGAAALGGGIGDGTLPFNGRASLAIDPSARLELRLGREESGELRCSGETVNVVGRLQLQGASYPIRGACVGGAGEVRMEAATSAMPVELQGRFKPEGFVGTIRWNGQDAAPVTFSVLP